MASEKKIIRGLKAGKRNAYNLLYKQYAAMMLGMCVRYCRNREEAEDVLQEGFIKVFTYIGKFRGEGSFEGWIRRIMINTAINSYQKNQKYSNQQNFEDLESVGELLEKTDENAQGEALYSRRELEEAIKTLPEGYKIVFNLFAIEGYSHKDISEMLEISENTSKTQLFKARKFIIRQLNEIKNKGKEVAYKSYEGVK